MKNGLVNIAIEFNIKNKDRKELRLAEELEFYLIFSEFDDTMGPIPKLYYPNVEFDLGHKVATKSINLLAEDQNFKSKHLAFLPFPAEGKKGIALNLEWQDMTRRGGVATGALTLLFNEADDLIYYKYVRDLEVVFNEASKILIDLKNSKADSNTFSKEIKNIHKEFLVKLTELSEHELGGLDASDAFPDEETSEDNDIFSFKVVVCGDIACGKTSTILRFTQQAFRRTYIPTLGVNMTRKEVQINNKKIILVLWDIAGQMKFKLMRRGFYEGVRGILLLYDITRPDTFIDISSWYEDIKNNIKRESEPITVLCGNKKDLDDKRMVSMEDGKNLASELNIKFLETSALTGENIDQAFQYIANKLTDAFEPSILK